MRSSRSWLLASYSARACFATSSGSTMQKRPCSGRCDGRAGGCQSGRAGPIGWPSALRRGSPLKTPSRRRSRCRPRTAGRRAARRVRCCARARCACLARRCARVEDDDAVGLLHGRKPVRHDDRRAAHHQPIDRILHGRSLSASSALVASSSSRIGGSRRMARAMAMRCRCPPDSHGRVRPRTCRSPAAAVRKSWAAAAWAAASTSASVASGRP